MARPPVIPVDDKQRMLLSVVSGEMTVAEAARRNKVSEQSIFRWKQQSSRLGGQSELVQQSLGCGDDRLCVLDRLGGFVGGGVIGGRSGYSSSLRRRRRAPNWRKPGPNCARAPLLDA